VNDNRSSKLRDGKAAHRMLRGLVALFAVVAISGVACAQQFGGDQVEKEEITFGALANVPAPVALTPPAGNSEYLLGHATGTQGYVCLPTATGASWTVNGARPEATLFTNIFGEPVQIITHFLSPNTSPNQFAPNPLHWQRDLAEFVR